MEAAGIQFALVNSLFGGCFRINTHMRLHEITEGEIPGIVKQSLTQFFAKHIGALGPGPRFSPSSLSKRMVGSLLGDLFFLRNATRSRDENRQQKLDKIIRPHLVGAVKAMRVDHPEMMTFIDDAFVNRLLANVAADADNLYTTLSY